MNINIIKLSFIFVLMCYLASCTKKPAMEIVEGVSLELAQYRFKSISDIRYDLNISIPKAFDDEISADVTINFTLRDLSQPLILDFNENEDKILQVKVGGQPSNYEFTNGHIVIPSSFLSQGENNITIEFVAGENSLNRNESYLYTLFVPDRASSAFPCFDQPNLKARFKLTLEIPENWTAVANGAQVEETTSNGRKVCKFRASQPISTYLFSFAAGEFQQIVQERGGRQIGLFHRETDEEKVKENVQAIFDLHDAALKWLEEYTGIAYPFEKFDFVLIPSFQYGGMEHPGAILYRASSLFLEKSATQNQKLGRASLIAHETAHMWFGNLVTMDWFNDVWMKEVFANFMAAKIVNPSFPDIDHSLRFLLRHYPSAYEVDRSQGANPIRQELENLKDAGTLYGAIIYQKAPIVMRQLERLIGENIFQEGLREYLDKFSYANATWPDLVGILDAKTSEDLRAWSQVWVEESGRPNIKTEIGLNEKDEVPSLSLEQKDPLNRNRFWNQQMTVVISRGANLKRFPIQLRDQNTDVAEMKGLSEYDFVLANGDGFGYGDFELNEVSRAFLLHRIDAIEQPVTRGVAWITLWDEMLNRGVNPQNFLASALNGLEHENDPQIIQSLLGYLETAYWKFQSEDERKGNAGQVEDLLWRLLRNPPDKGVQASYFRVFRSIALSDKAVSRLERIWEKKLTIPGLTIQENDMTDVAFELALKRPSRAEEILRKQKSRIKNPDRKSRFEFIIPALSIEESTRDDFFESLMDEKSRAHEPWVLTALNYLHHPLRTASSEKYLLPSLEILQEIQRTGDIFFPKRWLDATFSGHNSRQAAKTVQGFLAAKPDFPRRLKGKILQSTDLLFRASEIVNNGGRNSP